MRFSVQSMKWQQQGLEVTFCSEFVRRNGGYPGRSRWAFLHPWFGLYVLYWDAAGAKLPAEVSVDCLHDPDFVFGKVQQERQLFRIEPPPEAYFLAVQIGTSPWSTKRVPLRLG